VLAKFKITITEQPQPEQPEASCQPGSCNPPPQDCQPPQQLCACVTCQCESSCFDCSCQICTPPAGRVDDAIHTSEDLSPLSS
jgi:hypothetical protein